MSPEPEPEPKNEPEPEGESEATKEAYKSGMISLHLIYAIACIVLNAIVIVALLLKKNLRLQLSSPYMLSVLIASLLVGLIILPVGASSYFNGTDLVPKAVCALNQYISHLTMVAIYLTLAEHAWANLRYGLFGDINSYGAMCLICSWVIAALWALSAIFIEDSTKSMGSDVPFSVCGPEMNAQETYTHIRWVELALFVAAPVAIVLTCNHLHKMYKEKSNAHNIAMIHLSLALLVAAIICQVPLRIYSLVSHIGPIHPTPLSEPEPEPNQAAGNTTVSDPEPEPERFGKFNDNHGMTIQTLLIIMYSNAIVNPLLIIFMNSGVKEAVFFCFKRRKNSVNNSEEHIAVAN